MIAYLEGRLTRKTPSQILVLVNGVGYKLFIPVSTYYELPEEGAEVKLHVHTYVREDVLALYGFASATEERLFQRLIAVNGVGPALALKVMSGLEPSALVDAIRSSDLRRLGSIPGVGRKTAERLILELRDKLDAISVAVAAAGTRDDDDIVNALLALGYNEREAAWAVKQLPDGATVNDGIRQALKLLSKQ